MMHALHTNMVAHDLLMQTVCSVLDVFTTSSPVFLQALILYLQDSMVAPPCLFCSYMSLLVHLRVMPLL